MIIIEELVDILKREKAVDIFVAKIPPTYRYADYLVIATGKSARHILAMSEFIRKVFKKKMNSDDKVPVLEGKNSKNWMALDLGNIVVHIFSQSAREYYDLETLWSVGPEYDSQSIKKDNENSRILADYSAMLASLTPIMPKK